MNALGRGVRLAAGLVVAALLAWLLFRGTDWPAVGASLAGADRGWIALAAACAFGGQFLRAWRLAVIVSEHTALPYREAFYATQIGMLANVALPLRIGEGVRVLVLLRRAGVDLSTAVGAAVVDRVTDMVALFVVAGTAVAGAPAFHGIRIEPGMLQNAEPIVVPAAVLTGILGALSAMLSALLAGLALARFSPGAMTKVAVAVASPLPAAVRAPLLAVVESLIRTAGQLASPRVMLAASVVSLAAWGCGVGTLYALLSAFGFEVPWWAPWFILSLIATFMAAPLTPGLVGQYHVPVLAGVLLVHPGVDASTARAATMLGYVLFLVPVTVLGVVALLGARLGAGDLVRSVATAARGASAPR